MGFSWEITVRSLLTLKLSIMERVLAQRIEILRMLHPVLPDKALDWLLPDEPPAPEQVHHDQHDAGPSVHAQVTLNNTDALHCLPMVVLFRHHSSGTSTTSNTWAQVREGKVVAASLIKAIEDLGPQP